jgi:hypothetical protein
MGWDIIIRNADDAPVCSAIDAGYTKKTAEANARLIASAPELLATLEWAVSCQPSDDSCAGWVSDARAAIAKAKGRS